MPHEAASRASMAIDSSTGRVPSETALPTKGRAAASPLGGLVRLLARQAARESIASGLGRETKRVETNPAATGRSAEK
jgi:hypothetical protein